MKRLLKNVLFEHDELSIKRIITWILVFIMLDLYLKVRSCDEISEAMLFLFGELLSGIFLLLGLIVANKHKALNKTTNSGETLGENVAH